jgi:hypothetical protein
VPRLFSFNVSADGKTIYTIDSQTRSHLARIVNFDRRR